MDDDERKKKLQAGRERLAKFQKKKVSPEKRRKKKPKPAEAGVPSLDGATRGTGNGGVLPTAHLSDDSLDAGDSSVTSSDVFGTHSDLVSPISFESDQRSIGTDDLCEDSDGGQLDAEVVRIELREARGKIHQLEESLFGKQAALEEVNRENEELRAKTLTTTNGPSNGTVTNEGAGSVDKEAEYRAAFEQYNLKIQEFQQALQQRDDVIRHLSTSLQGALTSRDDIQQEAAAQTEQLALQIQTLQSQLQQAGDSLKEQNGGHSSLAEELSHAQDQVMALRQTVDDKESAMQTLAQRYAQKSKELVESIEEKEELRRHSAEEIMSLSQQLKEQGGDLSPESRERSLATLQAELDESYGNQIVMIKEQLQERHQQDKDLLVQKCSELERHMDSTTENNKRCEELEQQISNLKDELATRDSENRRNLEEISNVKQKLADTVEAYEKHTDKLYTTQMALEEEQGKADALRAQLEESTQDLLGFQDSQKDEVNTLKRSLQQHIAEADRLATVNIDYEDQIAKLKADHEEVVAELNTKLETSLDEKVGSEDAHKKELESLKAELETLKGNTDAPVDVDELRRTIEEELKEDYDEKMDDMKYSHEIDLKRLQSELRVEYQDDLKEIQNQLEEQYVQKVESIRSEKDREFVAELQHARQELQEKLEVEVAEKIEAERKRLKQLELHQTSLDDTIDQVDLINRLQNENQDLSEARDALLQQIDASHHVQEELQEELLNVINEKDRLNAENDRLLLDLDALETGQAAENQGLGSLQERLEELPLDSHGRVERSEDEKSQIEDELDRLRVELESSKKDKAAYNEQMERLNQDHQAKVEQLGEETSKVVNMLEATKGELESHKSSAVRGEGDNWVGERSNLLREKEHLQHLLEKTQKEFEAQIAALEEEKNKHAENERSLGEEKEALVTKVIELEQGRNEIKEELAQALSQLNENENVNHDLDTAMANLKMNHSNESRMAQEQHNEDMEQIKQLQEIVSEMKNINSKLKLDSSIHEEAKQQIEALSDELSMLKSENNELKSDMAVQISKNAEFGHDLAVLGSVKENHERMTRDLTAVQSENEILKKDMEQQRSNFERQVAVLKNIHHDEVNSATGNNGRKSPEMTAAEKQNAILRDSLEQTAEDRATVASELVQLRHEHDLLRTSIDMKEAEITALKEQLQIADDERKHAVGEWRESEQELGDVRAQVEHERKQRWQVEERLPQLQARLESLQHLETELTLENEHLKEELSALNRERDTELAKIELSEKNLEKEVEKLKKELNETTEIFTKENALLKDALQHEKDAAAQLLKEKEDISHEEVSSLRDEVNELRQKILRKEQTEHEILTEKTRQIGVLQESNARLENERENLKIKLTDLEKQIKTTESVSEEVQDVFGQQLTELQTQQKSLKNDLEQQKSERLNLSDILNDSASREENLKREKELLLNKLSEKEEIQERLMQERLELQRRIQEQQKLEALLDEKDHLEQELSRQKRSLECDLRDIEQQLQQREQQLLTEKSDLEAELRHKDVEVRRWEVGYREQQLEYRHRETFLKKRYDEGMTTYKDGAEKDKLARLQRLRMEKDRLHADAVAKLRRDLRAEFDDLSSRSKEQHLSDVSLLKTRHQSQMEELRKYFEEKLQGLQDELENERKHQLGTVKDVHERERQRELSEMKDRHEWEMEALRGELDSKHYQIFNEMREQLEKAYKEEVGQVRREAKNEREIELASLRLSMEQIHTSQLEVERARLEHERAEALTELRHTLMMSHREDMEGVESRWAERLTAMEKRLEESSQRKDEESTNSKELIVQLKRRLSLEHQEVIESLADEWDQKVLEQLRTLRTEMEEKYKTELEAERELLGRGPEGKEELEREHRADVDLLLKERETLVKQAEEMRQNLDRVHQQELGSIQAKVQAEYAQLAKMREDLEQEKGQRESNTSLKSELFLLKASHAELKKQHEKLLARKEGADDEDLTLNERVRRDQALGEEAVQTYNREIGKLQDELTSVRAKLQDEHAEELDRLRKYFENRVVENENRWAQEMGELKTQHEAEREHALRGASEDEEGGRPIQRSYAQTMMMMTHLSDVESSPPQSPERFAEIEAEVKQQLRSELRGIMEEDYQTRMENLKEELAHEHNMELERRNLQFELKLDADLEAAKITLNSRHSMEMETFKQNQLEELEALRQQLSEENTKAITKLRLECAVETARQVEEETQRIKEELKFTYGEELSQMKDDLEHKHALEMDNVQGELELQKEIEGKRVRALSKDEFDSQFRAMQADLEQQAQDKITDEVARILAELTMEKAQEMEVMEMVLTQHKEKIQELETKKQDLQDKLDNHSKDEENVGEKYNNEFANLKQQLSDTELTLQTLREGIKNGTAPEVEELKENLVRQYDNQLEMIKATMTEEIESLTRNTQLQSAKELEEMQLNFMQEHQAMLDKFVESQDGDILDLKQHHDRDLEDQHERLQNEYEQELNDAQEALQEEQAKEMEELRKVLEEEHEKELNDLKALHFDEIELLKVELVRTLNEEKVKMQEQMEKERAQILSAEELLESLKAKYEEEKAREKEDLVTDHMTRFRQVTDELEVEHRQELESMKDMLRNSIEKDFRERTQSLEEEIRGQQAELRTAQEKNVTELIELKQNHEEQLAKIRANHEDQLEAIATDSEREIESAKSELEEAHRDEILRLQSQLGDGKQDALIALKESHEREIERLKSEQDQRVTEAVEELMRKHQEEIEKALEELQEQLMKQAEQEKGELDQMMKEKEEQQREEVEKLEEKSNQLQQENMALVQQISTYDTVISRRERENEEGGNLVSMMRADMDRLNTDRETLQEANQHLLHVLTNAVRATMATEEAINRQMAKLAATDTRPAGEGRSDSRDTEGRTEAEGEAAEGVDGQPQGASGVSLAVADPPRDDSGDALHDTSVVSFLSDEGLELSQQLMESMFTGQDLDTEGVELVTGATTRLQNSVDRLLEMVSATAEQIQRARSSQAELLNATESSVEEASHLRADRDSLMVQLKGTTEARESLAVEIHRTEGLLEGLASEKQELEELNSKLEADKHNMAAELEMLKERVSSLDQAQSSLQQERERVEEQKAAFAQRLGEEDLGILQENLRLREEAEAILVERQDAERQTAKDKMDLKDQLQQLETAIEEQIARGDALAEKGKEETEELKRQLEVLEKQLKKNKQFLEQQTIEREQEREEFQREIVRLEEDQRSRDRTPSNVDELFRKEAQELREELREKSEEITQAQTRIQQLERDVHFAEDTTQELTSQLKEAERQLDEVVQSKQQLEAQTEELERDLGEQRHLEVDIMHEKETLQKQLYDQLIQISALQSKLDALKHGVETADGTGSSDSGEVVTSEVSLLKQLEDDKEALERKDKEIENLVEQLEQFREEIINKDEEICQMNMQIEVANREQDSGREDLQGQLDQALEEVHQLEDKVTSSGHDITASMPRFAQELLDEKNQEIDHLNEQLTQVMQDLEEAKQEQEEEQRPQEAAVGQAEDDKLKQEELENLQTEFKTKLQTKDEEIQSLKQSLGKEQKRDVPTSPSAEEKLKTLQKSNIQLKTQYDQDISSLKQMLLVREREVAHLEGLLVRLQEENPSGSNIKTYKSQIKALKQEIQDKDVGMTKLRLQLEDLEERLFQQQQQQQQQQDLVEEPPHLQQPIQDETNWQRLQREHELRIAELQQKHTKVLATLQTRHQEELGHLRESQASDVERLRELEMDYDRRMASLQGLSPGKTLEQKLREIRAELTRQHQEHVRDIQRTMERETKVLMEQLRNEYANHTRAREERHRHEMEEAVLRVNRDLMSAHAEEVGKIQEEHSRQLERVLAATPASASPMGSFIADTANRLSRELQATERLDSRLVSQLKTRQAGVGKERGPTEGAVHNGGLMNGGDIPDRLQAVLNRLHNEGLQVLTLSDLRYLRQQTSPRPDVQDRTDVRTLQDAWEAEKHALLDAIQALKDLISEANKGQWKEKSDESDWRGKLLSAIQSVFDRERDALLAELRTHVMSSGDRDLSQVQQLEKRIREQELHHNSSMEQVYTADRASLLAEVEHVRAHSDMTALELQEQRQKLTSQLNSVEEHGTNRERQLKRQLEMMEHKYRQERVLVEDLQTSLAIEKEKVSQLADALNREKNLVMELQNDISELQIRLDRLTSSKERLEAKLAEVTGIAEGVLAQLESEKSHTRSLQETLESEQQSVQKLHETLDTETQRTAQVRLREQTSVKDLRHALEDERNKMVETYKDLEKEKIRAEALKRELDAEKAKSSSVVNTERSKTSDLKTALDIEKTRCQELHSALHREQALNTQLHESLDQERSAYAENSHYEKSNIGELQALLDSEKSRNLDLRSKVNQLENTIAGFESVSDGQRRRSLEALEEERAVCRQLRATIDSLQVQQDDVNRKLSSEQERVTLVQQESERLKASLLSQKEEGRERDIIREKERQIERQRHRERERERELERQRQSDFKLERELDRQKIQSLEGELDETRQSHEKTSNELEKLRDAQRHFTPRVTEEELQQAYDEELSRASPRHSPHSTVYASRLQLYKAQLEAVRQRLQLLAVRQQEEVARLHRVGLEKDQQELTSLQRGLTETLSELKQLHSSLALHSETMPVTQSPSASRLNDRLLVQNAELSNFASRLSEEKTEMRSALANLEEEVWRFRQREAQLDEATRRSLDNTDIALAEERAMWSRERHATQSALQKSESQIAHLKAQLQHEAAKRDEGSPHLGGSGEFSEHQHLKLQKMYGKYLRAESFRKALVYQKRYLLLLLGGFQDCEQATLQLIARMGAYPAPEDLERRSRHSKAFTRFRSAARAVIAVSRLKFLVRKWRRATRVGTPVATGTLQPDLTSPSPRGLPSTSIPSVRVTTPVRRGAYLVNGASPPVRDVTRTTTSRTIFQSSHHRARSSSPVLFHGASSTSPRPDGRPSGYHSASHLDRTLSRSLDRPLDRPLDTTLNGDPEASLTNYIQKLESLQQRLGAHITGDARYSKR
ncbi:A-kinase anchor protein 9-like isoform X2 [Asterias rubens]|uniref:A-kinase anchor protein 9-like isoform X2 n=1 Tax=Asterias rubens TaxID=7604 RepID=UPI00145509BA|nr:A-kinase anchor protein 9-like isoform X2 [Asterias rubens]